MVLDSKDYILEYISWIDDLLEASLSCEALADEDELCQQCNKGSLAVLWCKDCSIGIVLESLVIRTGQNRGPNWTRTDENRTIGPVLDFFLPIRSLVLSFSQISRIGQRPVQTS